MHRAVESKVTKRKRAILKRCRPEGPRFTKKDATRERNLFDPVGAHLRRVAEGAAHTGDRGLCANWERLLRDSNGEDQ